MGKRSEDGNPFEVDTDDHVVNPEDLDEDADGGAIVRSGTKTADALQLPAMEVAEADMRLDALRIDKRKRVEELAKGDEELARMEAQIAKLEAARAESQAALDEAFANRSAGLKLTVTADGGTLAVTWPKPRERVVSRARLSAILKRSEAGDTEAERVADYLGLHRKLSKPSSARVSWKPK